MYNLEADSYLSHHGILGQKWGIRRYQNEDGSLTEAGKKHYYNSDGTYTDAGKRKARNDIRKERRLADKNRSLMDDSELNTRIQRLQKEKQLHELTVNETNRGRTDAEKTLRKYAAQSAAVVVGIGAAKLGKAAIKSIFG